ncbi:MAG: hypothetical protein NVS1B3_08250 [Candidatus Dormibacteraceae bacterium]
MAGFSILKFAFSPEASVVWPRQSTTAVPLQEIVVAADALAGSRANPSPRIDPAQSRRSIGPGFLIPHFPLIRCGLVPMDVSRAMEGVKILPAGPRSRGNP